jgi:two-component system phosphate regulon response regulator PhoB
MSTTQQHVLVVDDEPDFVAYIETVLREDGFTVSTAFDGEEALLRVRETPPDLVTLDIQMPRKTGVLFYRQMKSNEKLRSIPVIVVTGLRRMSEYAGPFVERFFEVDGLPLPEAYLDKPVDKDQLLSVVKEKLAVGEAAVPS